MKIPFFLKRSLIILSTILPFVAAIEGNAQEIKLVTGNNYQPYSDQNLPQGGLATDIVSQAFKKAGFAPIVEFMGWSRALEETTRGNYFATFPWSQTKERAEIYDFSAPVFSLKSYAVFHKNYPLNATSINDLANKRFCLPFGYAVPPALKPFIDSGRMLVEDPDWEASCMLMLEKDRVDFVGLGPDRIQAQADMANVNVNNYVSSPFPINEQTLGLLVSRKASGYQPVLDRFNKALAEMDASGELDALFKKHNVIRQ